MSSLEGKVAIISGAGSGIGRATALALAASGARVVVADRLAERADQVAAEIKALGHSALAASMDVTQPADCTQLVQQALAAFGALDILIANAGIQRRYFVHELPPSEFQAMLDVNLLGVYHCCQAVLPILYAQQSGNIVIIASDSGKRGYAYNAAYCASKFAVLGFMEALADEARRYHVRVNAVCPGGTKTRMGEGLHLADGNLIDQTHFMTSDEVADVVVFLASAQSRGIHGQSLNVYGGVAQAA